MCREKRLVYGLMQIVEGLPEIGKGHKVKVEVIVILEGPVPGNVWGGGCRRCRGVSHGPHVSDGPI